MSTIYENMCDVGSVDHESSLTPPTLFSQKEKERFYNCKLILVLNSILYRSFRLWNLGKTFSGPYHSTVKPVLCDLPKEH